MMAPLHGNEAQGTDWENLQPDQHPTPCWHHIPSCWLAMDRAAGDTVTLLNSVFPWTQGNASLRAMLQTTLSAESQLRPLECLSAPSPLVCFMGVLNHSTHHGAEGKGWFIRPTCLVLAEWESHTEWFSLFTFFLSFKCLNKIPVEYRLDADQGYSSPVRPFVMVS